MLAHRLSLPQADHVTPAREGWLARILCPAADRAWLAELPPHLRRDLGLPIVPPAPPPLPDGWR